MDPRVVRCCAYPNGVFPAPSLFHFDRRTCRSRLRNVWGRAPSQVAAAVFTDTTHLHVHRIRIENVRPTRTEHRHTTSDAALVHKFAGVRCPLEA